MEKEYKNVLKTTLTRENYKKVVEDKEMGLEFYVWLYHRLGRDKKKFNKAVESLIDNKDEFTKLIDRKIELHREAIKKLKRIKIGYVIENAIRGYR